MEQNGLICSKYSLEKILSEKSNAKSAIKSNKIYTYLYKKEYFSISIFFIKLIIRNPHPIMPKGSTISTKDILDPISNLATTEITNIQRTENGKSRGGCTGIS